MASPERLKVDRALSTLTAQPRKMYLVSIDQDDPRERPTDPIGTAPPESAEAAVAQAQAFPRAARLPAGLESPIVPSDRADSLEPPGYDPDKWEHYKIARLIESLGAVRMGLAAVSPSAQEALIAKVASQTATEVANRFRPLVEAAERRIMGEVNALGREQRRTTDDVTELRQDLAKLERRIAEIEMREREAKSAAGTSTPTG